MDRVMTGPRSPPRVDFLLPAKLKRKRYVTSPTTRRVLNVVSSSPSSPTRESIKRFDIGEDVKEKKPRVLQLLTPPNSSSPVAFSRTLRSVWNPTIITGDYNGAITIGRGNNSTFRIDKNQKQVSRNHAFIDYDAKTNAFVVVVQGQNGIKINGHSHKMGEVASLVDCSLIDIVGKKYLFQIPVDEYKKNEILPSCSSSPSRRFPLGEIVNGSIKEPMMATAPFDNASEIGEEDALLISSVDQGGPILEKKVSNPRTPISPVKSVPDSSISDLSSLPSDYSFEDEDEDEDEEEHSKDLLCGNDKNEPISSEQLSGIDLASLICDALVFSRVSSMPVSEIYFAIMTSQPTLKDVNPGPPLSLDSDKELDDLSDYETDEARKNWKRHIVIECKSYEWFGEIKRTGKDAAGRNLENEYFYKVDSDPDNMRKEFYAPIIKPTRACRATHKQYYWKKPALKRRY